MCRGRSLNLLAGSKAPPQGRISWIIPALASALSQAERQLSFALDLKLSAFNRPCISLIFIFPRAVASPGSQKCCPPLSVARVASFGARKASHFVFGFFPPPPKRVMRMAANLCCWDGRPSCSGMTPDVLPAVSSAFFWHQDHPLVPETSTTLFLDLTIPSSRAWAEGCPSNSQGFLQLSKGRGLILPEVGLDPLRFCTSSSHQVSSWETGPQRDCPAPAPIIHYTSPAWCLHGCHIPRLDPIICPCLLIKWFLPSDLLGPAPAPLIRCLRAILFQPDRVPRNP